MQYSEQEEKRQSTEREQRRLQKAVDEAQQPIGAKLTRRTSKLPRNATGAVDWQQLGKQSILNDVAHATVQATPLADKRDRMIRGSHGVAGLKDVRLK